MYFHSTLLIFLNPVLLVFSCVYSFPRTATTEQMTWDNSSCWLRIPIATGPRSRHLQGGSPGGCAGGFAHLSSSLWWFADDLRCSSVNRHITSISVFMFTLGSSCEHTCLCMTFSFQAHLTCHEGFTLLWPHANFIIYIYNNLTSKQEMPGVETSVN